MTVPHRPAGTSVVDEARVVASIRAVTSDDPQRWARWSPEQRLLFVLSRLFELPGGTPWERRMSEQALQRVVRDRRTVSRAREILAAVALVDDHPPSCPPLIPTTWAPS